MKTIFFCNVTSRQKTVVRVLKTAPEEALPKEKYHHVTQQQLSWKT